MTRFPHGTSIAPILCDFMLKWSHYYDSAWHSVRWALDQFAGSANRPGEHRSSRNQETETKEISGAALEKLAYAGNLKNSRFQICQRMAAGETVVLEGFPLETVAALCDQHNYRWTFGGQPNGKTNLRFIIRPGPKLTSKIQTAKE